MCNATLTNAALFNMRNVELFNMCNTELSDAELFNTDD